MSPNDRCAREGGCPFTRAGHMGHDFVEPAPQAESAKPSVDHAPVRCRHCVANGYGICRHTQPDPDAAVRALTFDEFTEINRRRCESYNGFGESLQPSSAYTVSHWAMSIASEAGEVCDAILGWEGLKRSKKDKTKEDVGRELADVVTYCDLLASKLGFRLSDLVVAKFEEINERCGFGTRFAIARRGKDGING